MSTTSSNPALDAFKRAVVDDYSGQARYAMDTVVLPAEIDLRGFLRAVEPYDPETTTVVFVRGDGAQLIASPRSPRSLRERVLARLWGHPIDVEILPGEGRPRLYHDDRRYARTSRAIVKHELRAFAGA